jgi:hypothetical protein
MNGETGAVNVTVATERHYSNCISKIDNKNYVNSRYDRVLKNNTNTTPNSTPLCNV